MGIEQHLKYVNSKAGKRQYDQEQAAKQRKHEERTAKTVDLIRSKYSFTEDEIKFIININELIMGVDGTAEQWSYDKDPIEYIESSIEVFELSKAFFNEQAQATNTPEQ